MNKKTFGKVLLLIACAVLLVAGSVFGTLAYLTSKDAVTNTFTVGKVVITLDEAKVDEYGVADNSADRVKQNAYKLIPGKTYTKDPVIHVDAESENCYVFVKIENNIAAIATIGDMPGWTCIDSVNYIYTFERVVAGGENIPTFATFTVRGELENTTEYDSKTITVTAYAVQADGFATAEDAWDATFGAPTNP